MIRKLLKYKSLYPSIMLEFNISPSTQVGKVTIEQKVFDNENAFNVEEEKYSRGGEFLENFVTDNIIEFSKRWLHLAGFQEMLEDIDEFYNRFGFLKYQDMYYSNSPIVPILNYKEEVNNRIVDAIEFENKYIIPKQYSFDNIQKGLAKV